jgi:starch synthase
MRMNFAKKTFRHGLRLVTTASLTVLLASAAWAQPLKVLMVSPEQSGVLQSGGLAHAVTGLAAGLNEQGIKTEVLMPHFLEMKAQDLKDTGERFETSVDWREGKAHKISRFSLLKTDATKVPTLFLRHDHREGETNYFDNRSHGAAKVFYAPEAAIGESFGAFSKAAADYILSKNYDVVILNDWTTGLIAAHLDEARQQGKTVPKVIFAIHNMAYQGMFPKSLVEFLGHNPRHFQVEGYEFWGQVNFLKAGLHYSDLSYTVSDRYSKEIQTPRFGAGLDGLMRRLSAEGRLKGILNGITSEEWDPSREKSGLKHRFTPQDLTGKALGKSELQAELALPVQAEVPLFIMTSRLAEQKGLEYLIDAIDVIAKERAVQFVVIGNGDERYKDRLLELEKQHPTKVRFRDFSGPMEAKLTRYGDFFVNGAWFEPSGLNQFFALLNGTIPVVSAAGGLMDSVKHRQNGLLFEIQPGANGEGYDSRATAEKAVNAFREAIAIYQDKKLLNEMRVRGMKEDHSWSSRIRAHFIETFEELLNRKLTPALPAPNVIPACRDAFPGAA